MAAWQFSLAVQPDNSAWQVVPGIIHASGFPRQHKSPSGHRTHTFEHHGLPLVTLPSTMASYPGLLAPHLGNLTTHQGIMTARSGMKDDPPPLAAWPPSGTHPPTHAPRQSQISLVSQDTRQCMVTANLGIKDILPRTMAPHPKTANNLPWHHDLHSNTPTTHPSTLATT